MTTTTAKLPVGTRVLVTEASFIEDLPATGTIAEGEPSEFEGIDHPYRVDLDRNAATKDEDEPIWASKVQALNTPAITVRTLDIPSEIPDSSPSIDDQLRARVAELEGILAVEYERTAWLIKEKSTAQIEADVAIGKYHQVCREVVGHRQQADANLAEIEALRSELHAARADADAVSAKSEEWIARGDERLAAFEIIAAEAEERTRETRAQLQRADKDTAEFALVVTYAFEQMDDATAQRVLGFWDGIDR